MAIKRSKYLAFVIDTDEYAGNFEREMCAYVTSVTGDCNVGDEVSLEFMKEIPVHALQWFDQHIKQMADEHGCFRPVSIWPTPGWFNSGMGGEYRENADPATVKADHAKAVKEYEEQHKTHLGDKGPGKYPAYLSVAIFVDQQPPDTVAAVMRQRAIEYAKKPKGRIANFRDGKPIHVTGFRLIQVEEMETILNQWSK